MNNLSSLTERMKQVISFKNISDLDLSSIVQAGNIRRYSAENIIFFEGAPSYGFCVLLRGEIHLYKLGPEGQENILAVIKPVIMFNEVAAIDGEANPVSAIAYKNSIVWHADFENFQHGLETFPELGVGLLPVLARRNRKLIDKYSALSFLPVRARVAMLLLELSHHGRDTIVRKNHSIQEMAAHIATTPVVISRSLGELGEDGYIECTRKAIKIICPEKLSDLALDLNPAQP